MYMRNINTGNPFEMYMYVQFTILKETFTAMYNVHVYNLPINTVVLL